MQWRRSLVSRLSLSLTASMGKPWIQNQVLNLALLMTAILTAFRRPYGCYFREESLASCSQRVAQSPAGVGGSSRGRSDMSTTREGYSAYSVVCRAPRGYVSARSCRIPSTSAPTPRIQPSVQLKVLESDDELRAACCCRSHSFIEGEGFRLALKRFVDGFFEARALRSTFLPGKHLGAPPPWTLSEAPGN